MLSRGEPFFARTLTNTKGRFAFQRVPPGAWLIGPENVAWGVPRPDRPVPLAQVVELPAGVPGQFSTSVVRASCPSGNVPCT